nr:winged helix-turn-helix transcriptional regulator [Lactiplantibacillus argentoratensis]
MPFTKDCNTVPVIPPKVEYHLSDIGESMRPIINSMADWGSDYLDNHPDKRKVIM